MFCSPVGQSTIWDHVESESVNLNLSQELRTDCETTSTENDTRSVERYDSNHHKASKAASSLPHNCEASCDSETDSNKRKSHCTRRAPERLDL